MGQWGILAIMGAVFIVLGVGGIIWGIREEKRIFEALASKHDLREFTLEHVETPQPGALKAGGWIALAVGVIALVVSLILWRVT